MKTNQFKELNINNVQETVILKKKFPPTISKAGIEFMTISAAIITYYNNQRYEIPKKWVLKASQIGSMQKIDLGALIYIEAYFNHLGTLTVKHFQEVN